MNQYYSLLIHDNDGQTTIEITYQEPDGAPRVLTFDECLELIEDWFTDGATFTLVEI